MRIELASVLAMLLVVACGTRGPEDTVDAYLSAVRDSNFEEMIRLSAYDEEYMGHLSRSEIEQSYEQFDLDHTTLEWEIRDSEITLDGNNAIVTVEILQEGGVYNRTELREFPLSATRGEWRISSYSSSV